jgi:primosomal protein N' (replication factor Y)
MVRGWRRRRFIAQAGRAIDLSAFMGAWRAAFKVPASVRVTIDIDPYSFL